MHRLCEANGIRYYHFLQPNQYVKGSKPMGDGSERWRSEKTTRTGRAAPRLPPAAPPRRSARGRRVRFTDLTMIFSDVRRPIYIDDCCHVDRFGYGLIAAELGRMARSDEALQ